MNKIKEPIAGEPQELTVGSVAWIKQIVDVANATIGAKISKGQKWDVKIEPGGLVIETPPQELFFGVANGVGACWEIPAKNVQVP
jgi:hypothetical protein